MQTLEERNARYHQNAKVTGFGEATTVHHPCPFCAAPDFMVCRVIDTKAAMSEDRTCAECGRGTRAIIVETPSTTTFELVQTSGDDPPPYMPMRRISEFKSNG